MKLKQRKCYDKLFVALLIQWIVIFVFFTTFCLSTKSLGNPMCQRALNTYSLVPSTLVKIEHSSGDVLKSVDTLNVEHDSQNYSTTDDIYDTIDVKDSINGERLSDDRSAKEVSKDISLDAKPHKSLEDGLEDITEKYKNHVTEDRYNYYKLNKIRTLYKDKFVIHDRSLCKDSSPDVIILVPTTSDKAEARTAIRNTYGSLSRDRKFDIGGQKMNFTVRVLFVFGKIKDVMEAEIIRKEHQLYNDVLQIDFDDSYLNLTRKVINSFRWVAEFCSNVSYVVKADDDIFINLPLLLSNINRSHGASRDVLFGYVYSGKRPVVRSGRWGVQPEVYPFSRYPQYISGTSYTISGNLMRPIVHYAQYFPYLNIEDAFITGVICNKVLGARLEHFPQSSHFNDQLPNGCEFVQSRRYSQTKMTPQSMYSIWNIMLNYEKHCSTA